MPTTIVNPQAKYRPVRLIQPRPFGYLHIAAAVDPPTRPFPFPRKTRKRAALLARLNTLARQLETLPTVHKATVYRAVLVPPTSFPPTRDPARWPAHLARFDVAVLIETTSPEVIDQVQTTEPYKLLIEAVTHAATDVHVMTARCAKCVGDVDKTRQGLFLFNYFTADDTQAALEVWDHLAEWYRVQTSLDNSTLLTPIGKADYAFVNHARWDYSLPRFMYRQFAKRSFWTYLLANLRANRIGTMSHLYHLA
jgi:hypothetical protein